MADFNTNNNSSAMTDAENAGPPPVDAMAFTSVSTDSLQATVRLKPPENGGKPMSYEMLKIHLARNRIVFGVDEDTLRMLGSQPVYGRDWVIARGVEGEDGVDARLIYHIDTNRQLRPKEKEDGSVDFKDLGAIQEAVQGQLLCEKAPATPGRDGTDVSGRNIPRVRGRDVSLPEGQNTVVSEDKLKLHAGLDGHISVAGGKVSVLNTFTVRGDVSVETGNIDFSGNVVVRGDVASGFSIRADGDVTVDGVVEAAKITAGGTLVIRGGFLGGDSGILDISGNAVCRFIESGQVNVRGDLETTYIMNATVRCGGAVNLTGKGLIRGGYVSARTSVTANFLGSPKASSANTTIEIGNDVALLEHYEQLKAEAGEMAGNISQLEAIITPMEKARASGVLAADKASQLEKAKAMLATLQPSYETLRETLATLEGHVSRLGRGTVNVRKTAYSGLKLVIGDETLILQHDHERISFYDSADGIMFVPLMNT